MNSLSDLTPEACGRNLQSGEGFCFGGWNGNFAFASGCFVHEHWYLSGTLDAVGMYGIQ